MSDFRVEGSRYPHSLRRTNPYALDASSVFDTLEDAISYARDDGDETNCPYDGLLISVVQGTATVPAYSIFVLKRVNGDLSEYTHKDREHFVLGSVSSASISDKQDTLSNSFQYAIMSELDYQAIPIKAENKFYFTYGGSTVVPDSQNPGTPDPQNPDQDVTGSVIISNGSIIGGVITDTTYTLPGNILNTILTL